MHTADEGRCREANPQKVKKVISAMAQSVGLTINVNDTSVEAEDDWIVHDENGPHILKVAPPKQSIDSATPGAASALKP